MVCLNLSIWKGPRPTLLAVPAGAVAVVVFVGRVMLGYLAGDMVPGAAGGCLQGQV